MHLHRGFTLPQLLTTLVVAGLLLALALPGFSDLIRNNRLEAATDQLRRAAHNARSHAVRTNHRVTLAAAPDWESGWKLFLDPNHNGQHDAGERLLGHTEPLAPDVAVGGNQPVEDYISYLGSGESRWATGHDGGGFQAGTITVCGESEGGGYKLVLSRGGRIRKDEIEREECEGL